MWVDAAAMAVASYLPRSVKSVARRLLFKNSHPAHLALRGVGAVQDLYYWIADGRLDTFLPVQNYFSVFFPMLETATNGSLTLFDSQGRLVGRKEFSVGHLGCVKLRLSRVLKEFGVEAPEGPTFGSLICNLEVPATVQGAVAESRPFYFWDRFYIGYLTEAGQPTFVHGVDKALIYHTGQEEPSRWYPVARTYQWAPEIPVNITEYERFTVVMLNRVSRPAQVRLVVQDTGDRSREWEATIQPNGIHRFELTQDNTAGLEPLELRLRIEGMTTQWGRPLVFKEFTNGAISVMHC